MTEIFNWTEHPITLVSLTELVIKPRPLIRLENCWGIEDVFLWMVDSLELMIYYYN